MRAQEEAAAGASREQSELVLKAVSAAEARVRAQVEDEAEGRFAARVEQAAALARLYDFLYIFINLCHGVTIFIIVFAKT